MNPKFVIAISKQPGIWGSIIFSGKLQSKVRHTCEQGCEENDSTLARSTTNLFNTCYCKINKKY